MSPAKNKKTEKASAIGFLVNFCAVFALIYITALLLVANILGGTSTAGLAAVSFPLQSNCSCDSCSADGNQPAAPATLFPVSAEDSSSGYIQIAVDDSGFAQKQIEISLSGSKMLEITNNGANPHSFVVDGLKIDSGAIEPGQTITVVLESLPAETLNYTYFSNVGNDDKAKFSGVITITE